ncbi:MAG: hypothetical protein RMZ41_026410 [Nostoc sp. DedVER02]|uniref:hypothetical protein n=1 Tax=unclassified Nostoc TaxID=2593658 RepID=UPI002AD57DA0|nr:MULTISPECIES: hypothetical protein [unclassified Nostoc]MDZ7987768.1 hypothetical protein [Nostoc sp. DedVER02]MDZ8110861.1 hypothetical protein [Nostoc sp. DedVER01b]
MYRALIEDIFSDPEETEETEEITFPATDKDLLILTEKFLAFEIPSKIFLQAIAIADYDGAAAFRYVDNYLTTLKNKNKRKHKKLLVLGASTRFDHN